MKSALSIVALVASASVVYGDVNASSVSIVRGPYKVKYTSFKHVPGMDVTDQKVNVWYPVGADGQKFPFISYAHGLFGGEPTWHQRVGYGGLLESMAEFGYIIASMEACSSGCSDLASLPWDPPGFKNFYKQQLRVIDWAKEMGAAGKAPFEVANFDLGVGIAGHSMGGQATVYSSSSDGAGHDIKAAVMHHAYTHSYPAPVVPFLAFTGSVDVIATPSMTDHFFNAEGANSTKGLVQAVTADHGRPDECSFPIVNHNCRMATYSAAWFKIFLDETPQADGHDYDAMIFGTGKDSVCHGGDGWMAKCEMHRGDEGVVVV